MSGLSHCLHFVKSFPGFIYKCLSGKIANLPYLSPLGKQNDPVRIVGTENKTSIKLYSVSELKELTNILGVSGDDYILF